MNQKTTLAQLLADPTSDSPAIVSTSPHVVISYRELDEQVESLAERLCGAGVKPGDSVALVLPNSLEFLIVLLALVRARLVAALSNPAEKEEALGRFVENAGAHAIFAEADNSAVKEVAASQRVWTWTPRLDSRGVVDVAGLPQHSGGSVTQPNPDEGESIASTSGTTHRQQKVPLS